MMHHTQVSNAVSDSDEPEEENHQSIDEHVSYSIRLTFYFGINFMLH